MDSFWFIRAHPRRYEVCQRGALGTLRSQLQSGRERCHRKGLLDANQQVGFREMLEDYARSNSPYS
jgi:hypothetical protein